jgi:hypothetical protein
MEQLLSMVTKTGNKKKRLRKYRIAWKVKMRQEYGQAHIEFSAFR